MTDWKDADVLDRLYWQEGKTLEEIGEELGCSKATIIRWMDKHQIPRRGKAEHFEDSSWRDEEKLRELYVGEKKSTVEIADQFGCAPKTIQRWLNHFDIDIRDGTNTSVNIYTDLDGYERIYDAKNKEYSSVHDLVACLDEDPEFVFGNDTHHLNGVKWDNRPENVDVMDKSGHSALHAEERPRNAGGQWA